MGLALVFGANGLWVVSFGIFSIIPLFRFPGRYKLSWPVFALASLLATSAVYGASWQFPLYAIGSLFVCDFIRQNPPVIKPWLYAICLITLIAGSVLYLQGNTRVAPIQPNASIMGMVGLVSGTSLAGTLFTGFSLSRTALAGFWLFAILRNQRLVWIYVLIASAMFAALTLATNPARITPSGLFQSGNARIETVTGENNEYIPDGLGGRIPATHKETPSFSILGYGYGGFTAATGTLQPHSPYILSLYELGALAIIYWFIVAVLWLKSRNWYLLTLIPVSLFVDDFYRLEGFYLATMFHLMTRSLPSPIDNWRGFDKIRIAAGRSLTARDGGS